MSKSNGITEKSSKYQVLLKWKLFKGDLNHKIVIYQTNVHLTNAT